MGRDADRLEDDGILHDLGVDVDTCVHLQHDLRIVSWNTRELLGSGFIAQRRRERKYLCLKKVCEKADVVCLQDTHGTHEYIQAFSLILPVGAWSVPSLPTTGTQEAVPS